MSSRAGEDAILASGAGALLQSRLVRQQSANVQEGAPLPPCQPASQPACARSPSATGRGWQGHRGGGVCSQAPPPQASAENRLRSSTLTRTRPPPTAPPSARFTETKESRESGVSGTGRALFAPPSWGSKLKCFRCKGFCFIKAKVPSETFADLL